MVVNLIKEFQIYTITLPDRVKGQFWISDNDQSGKLRKLIGIEARNDEWYIIGTSKAKIKDANNTTLEERVLKPLDLLFVYIDGEEKKSIIFAEPIDESRKLYKRYVAKGGISYTADVGI